MDADAMLLESASPGVVSVRLYEWDGPWVTIGRFQDSKPFEGRLWVRRPTGGRAVYHGEDWTLSVAVTLSTLEVDSRRLRATYELLTVPIAAALRECGAEASLAERTVHVSPRHVSRIDCFATTAPLDLVTADGAKVGGIALRMTDTAVLLQSSIPRAGWDWQEFPPAVQASFAEFAAGLEPATMKGL